MIDGFEKKYGCGVIYVNNMPDVLRQQVELCRKGDILFYLVLESSFLKAASPSVTTDYIRICSGIVNNEVFGSRDSGTL